MKITLLINKEERIFEAPFISARKLKKALEISEEVQKGFTIEVMDITAKFMVDVYGNQFTEDELLDGFEGPKYFEKVLEDMSAVLSGFSEKVKN